MRIVAHAPSNIALIKYMGKFDHLVNRPTNDSLSYTLNHLKSYVELEPIAGDQDRWEPLLGDKFDKYQLTPHGEARFLKHFAFLKQTFDYTGSFVISSANNFPAGCGLASSASSFAALTKCAEKAIRELKSGDLPPISTIELAKLSQQGSGSSCRSFFDPWSVWDTDGARGIEFPYENLIHQVVVVSSGEKKISSSEAHKKVAASLLFEGRIERAQNRMDQLVAALQTKNWTGAYELVWSDFWDMHALFETSTPHFSYMQPESLRVLRRVDEHWQKTSDGPLITMDAGPNIHLLYREDQRDISSELCAQLKSDFTVYESEEISK